MDSQVLGTDFNGAKPDETAALEALILGRLKGQVQNLRVVFVDMGVILRGDTRTYYAKQMAQQTVMGATNLPIFANELVVRTGVQR